MASRPTSYGTTGRLPTVGGGRRCACGWAPPAREEIVRLRRFLGSAGRPLNFTVRAHARDSWQEEDSILSKGRLGESFVWRQRDVRAPGSAGDFAWGLSARRNGFDASSAGLPA